MMNDSLKREIIRRVNNYESPKRIAFSSKYPVLKRPIIFLRCVIKHIQNRLFHNIQTKKGNDFFEYIITSHETELKRTSADVNLRLQENKIYNIKNAVERLNGALIRRGKTFSFWSAVGKPSYKNGYVDGRVYSVGKIVEGVGGGLCQLSTFLYWLFLGAPVKIVERYPHSIDVNPNPRQNISARGGATVLYNFMDLKIKNEFDHPLQLKIWLTGSLLKAEILSTGDTREKIAVFEKNHCFIKKGGRVYQYNEIHREEKTDGGTVKSEKMAANFAEVLYNVTDDYVERNGFIVFDYNDLNTP